MKKNITAFFLFTLLATTAKGQEYSNRFYMQQNGRNMTADDFEAWMKSQGIRVARGREASMLSTNAVSADLISSAPTTIQLTSTTPLPVGQYSTDPHLTYNENLERNAQYIRNQIQQQVQQRSPAQSSFVVDDVHTYEQNIANP